MDHKLSIFRKTVHVPSEVSLPGMFSLKLHPKFVMMYCATVVGLYTSQKFSLLSNVTLLTVLPLLEDVNLWFKQFGVGANLHTGITHEVAFLLLHVLIPQDSFALQL